MPDVNLTDTEREALARLFDPNAFEPLWIDSAKKERAQQEAYRKADFLLDSDWLAAHDRRVRAAALAPIQALVDLAAHDPEVGYYDLLGFLEDALAAAGVDAAPNETTTEPFTTAPVRVYADGAEVEEDLLAMNYEWGLEARLAGVDAKGQAFLAVLAEDGGDSVRPVVLVDHQHETSYGLAGDTPCGSCGCSRREWTFEHLAFPVRVLDDPARRAAVPSGHEQEGDGRG